MERKRIARLRERGHGVREIARWVKRAPSTVSRELRRNLAAHDNGVYDADLAHARARARRLRPGRGRLIDDTELRAVVQARLELESLAPRPIGISSLGAGCSPSLQSDLRRFRARLVAGRLLRHAGGESAASRRAPRLPSTAAFVRRTRNDRDLSMPRRWSRSRTSMDMGEHVDWEAGVRRHQVGFGLERDHRTVCADRRVQTAE
jgi:hypothetical protein